MSCEICGRSSCTRSFHSIEAQEDFDARKEMSDDVETLRCDELLAAAKAYLKTSFMQARETARELEKAIANAESIS